MSDTEDKCMYVIISLLTSESFYFITETDISMDLYIIYLL